MDSLQATSEAELQQTALHLKLLNTQAEKTKLALGYHGLANTDRYWSIIDAKMRNPYFTVEPFRQAITQNVTIVWRRSRVWSPQNPSAGASITSEHMEPRRRDLAGC
jgi:hypothetical protein